MGNTLKKVAIATTTATVIAVGSVAVVPETGPPQHALDRIEEAKAEHSIYLPEKAQAYDALVRGSSIDVEAKTMQKNERIELKSYQIEKKTKKGRYYYNAKNRKAEKKTVVDKVADRFTANAQVSTTSPLYEVEIVDTVVVEGGVDVYARAWLTSDLILNASTTIPAGTPVGFGPDGTIEIERFHILNPPVLVLDPDGEVERSVYDEILGTTTTYHLKEDPEIALQQVVGDTIESVGGFGGVVESGTVGNSTLVAYPDANPETTTFDGLYRIYIGIGFSWSTLMTGNGDGGTNDDVASGWAIGFRQTNYGAGSQLWRHVMRTDTLFDTSSIPDTDTISSATLSLSGNGTSAWDMSDVITATQRTLEVVEHDTTSNTAITATDMPVSTFGATSWASFDPGSDGSSWNDAGYNDFTFNATGISNVSKTGVTKLGILTGAELNNSEPGKSATDYAWWNVQIYFADQTGTTNDPKFTVEHSAGGGGASRRIIRTTGG